LIARLTTNLGAQPYNAALWTRRADMLVQVGYPELAAGDARKAQKLLEGMRDRKLGAFCLQARKQFLADEPVPAHVRAQSLYRQSFWDDRIKQSHLKNFQTLEFALVQTQAYYSLRESCKGMLQQRSRNIRH
jgi:hypothetical protein